MTHPPSEHTPKAPIVDSILELIGNTPLIALRGDANTASIWGKCEHLNPGGSVKDRICLAMLDQAEREGRLEAGAEVVEPTSGNTGIGLALISAVRGYKLVLTMPESMSLERRQLLEAYGVRIELTPAEDVMNGAIERADRIVEERGAYMPQQFDNPSNVAAHREGTAKEIFRAMQGESIDVFVAAVGTGGTVSGVGSALKEKNPDCRVVAVEPESSPVLAGGAPGPSKIQGINAGFIPSNYDASVVDEILHVTDRQAYDTKIRLAREEGLLVGISAGANVFAAREIASKLGPEKNVVTILCDTGERYFSLDEYFPE